MADKGEGYKTLPYSQTTREFNFCNIETFNAKNETSLKDFALQKTLETGGNVTEIDKQNSTQIIE